MCRSCTLQSAECHPCTLVAECHSGTSDSLRNFTPVVRQVFLQDFLPVLGARTAENYESVFLTGMRPDGAFDRRATKTWVRSFWGATMSQIFKNFYQERFRTFTPIVPKVFFQDFFTPFWCAMAGNYESVFLTVVWPNGAFDRCATKTWVRLFWPSCDYFPVSVLLTNGATNGGSDIFLYYLWKVSLRQKKTSTHKIGDFFGTRNKRIWRKIFFLSIFIVTNICKLKQRLV